MCKGELRVCAHNVFVFFGVDWTRIFREIHAKKPSVCTYPQAECFDAVCDAK